MAEMLGAHVMQILRLLTPTEVAKMTDVTDEVRRVSLTKLMQDTDADINSKDVDNQDEYAKILAFKKKDDGTEEYQEEALADPYKKVAGSDVVPDDQEPEQTVQNPRIIDPYAGDMNSTEAPVASAAPAQSTPMSTPIQAVAPTPGGKARTKEENKLASIGVSSQRMQAEQAMKEKEVRDSEKSSSSVFLLAEKEKSKRSQIALKKQEILGLYQESNKLDIHKSEEDDESDKEESFSVSKEKGVLFNKVQS